MQQRQVAAEAGGMNSRWNQQLAVAAAVIELLAAVAKAVAVDVVVTVLELEWYTLKIYYYYEVS